MIVIRMYKKDQGYLTKIIRKIDLDEITVVEGCENNENIKIYISYKDKENKMNPIKCEKYEIEILQRITNEARETKLEDIKDERNSKYPD